MKILLLFLYTLLPTQADYYYVVNIQCPVKQQGSNHLLVVGDSVDINAAFVFRSPRDKFNVYHPKKGSYEVAPKKRQPTSRPNEILALLKDNLLPTTETIILSTRSGMMNSPEDLGNYFQHYTKRLVIGTELLPLNSQGFPQRKDRYCFVRYQYKGAIVNQPLEFVTGKNDSLYLRLDQHIFRKGGNIVKTDEATDMQLMYYDDLTEVAVPLAKLQFVVVSEKQIVTEMDLVRRLSTQHHAGQADAADQVFTDVYRHLANNYGHPDIIVFRAMYDRMR
ncbi:hypothetical protein [uncultured Chitinophaga sp.]|uniref:hypothetical protein n=1 Tax=uncultured Chitinophaga sp. TaxID=339340 RepID=UPI0025D90632|nr:hypothetical protein [uncultured Chitinophaga sp.]